MTEPALAREKEAVHAARVRLTATIAALKAELAPKALARNAVHSAIEKGQGIAAEGIDTAKKYPVPLAGAVAALGLFLARRPIARLLTKDATPPAPESLTSNRPRTYATRKPA